MKEQELITFEYKNDILIATYIGKKSVTRSVAEQIVASRKAFTQGKPVKIVVLFPHLTNMDKGGRDYLSTDEAKEGVIAMAMVASTIIGKVIINFFLKFNNRGANDTPNKVFNNVEDALKWIKKIPVN